MVAKYVIVLSLAVAAYAGPLVTKVVYAAAEASANYDFSYSVRDSLSGDVKEQKEARAGDAVRGSYSILQPDGVHRIVEYTADKNNGFNAIVRYEGTPIQVAPAKNAVVAATVTYAAPVAKIAYAAPVVKAAYGAASLTQDSYSSPIVSYNH